VTLIDISQSNDLTTMAETKGRRALVLYGSETGNAQDVTEELGRIAERLRFDTDVAELNAVNLVRETSGQRGRGGTD
jgi:sulfite reductase alpha subunit-like flavoprotein